MKFDLMQDEPLLEFLVKSAPLARKLAQQHCQEAAKSGLCNGSYHGIWHYLRLLDLVASPLRSADFYLDKLSDRARQGDCANVMISGAADYTMMALVIEAYGRTGADCSNSARTASPKRARASIARRHSPSDHWFLPTTGG